MGLGSEWSTKCTTFWEVIGSTFTSMDNSEVVLIDDVEIASPIVWYLEYGDTSLKVLFPCSTTPIELVIVGPTKGTNVISYWCWVVRRVLAP